MASPEFLARRRRAFPLSLDTSSTNQSVRVRGFCNHRARGARERMPRAFRSNLATPFWALTASRVRFPSPSPLRRPQSSPLAPWSMATASAAEFCFCNTDTLRLLPPGVPRDPRYSSQGSQDLSVVWTIFVCKTRRTERGCPRRLLPPPRSVGCVRLDFCFTRSGSRSPCSHPRILCTVAPGVGCLDPSVGISCRASHLSCPPSALRRLHS